MVRAITQKGQKEGAVSKRYTTFFTGSYVEYQTGQKMQVRSI